MCSNYEAVTRADRMLAFFGVVHEDSPSIITFPTGLAPFIRLSEAGKRQAVDGHFGLLPHFAKELAFGRRTYNARSETVATLPSFRDAWRRGQRCIVPAEAIFEPSYETGKAVRWRIWQPGEGADGHRRHLDILARSGRPVRALQLCHAHGERGRPPGHAAIPPA